MPRRIQKCRCCKCAGDCRRPYRVVQLTDGRLDPPRAPIEFQPGAIEPRFQRWELWPGYNPSCIWQLKSGAVRHLSFGEVFSPSFATRVAIEELGLTYNVITQMTALDATAAIDGAMTNANFTEKQKAAWWRRALPFWGQPYDPADDYVPPTLGTSEIELTQQGTLVVRGPFATRRHIVNLNVRSPNAGFRPLTIDVRIGCDESGLLPFATIRLRLDPAPATGIPNAYSSHVLTSAGGNQWTRCYVIMELLNKDNNVVESAYVANFPPPVDPPISIANNLCALGDTLGLFPVRLAFTNEGGLRVEAMMNQRSTQLTDALDTGTPPDVSVGPPFRHLFAPLVSDNPLDGEYDISRIAVALTRCDNNTVSVTHRPLEQNDEGKPDFFEIPQGPDCAESDEAKEAIAAGTKTLCTSWSRSCHVTHSREDECYTELDFDLDGDVPLDINSSADIAAVLKGTFTLGNTNAFGDPLWQNSFWFHDDTAVVSGKATRTRIEISAVIGAHWPVPVCIGNEYPVEIAVFARATLSLPAPAVYSAVLRCRVSQRLLLGEKRSPDYWGNLGDDLILWDKGFPWGTRFWDKIAAFNTLLVNVTKCDFQLK